MYIHILCLAINWIIWLSQVVGRHNKTQIFIELINECKNRYILDFNLLCFVVNQTSFNSNWMNYKIYFDHRQINLVTKKYLDRKRVKNTHFFGVSDIVSGGGGAGDVLVLWNISILGDWVFSWTKCMKFLGYYCWLPLWRTSRFFDKTLPPPPLSPVSVDWKC